MRLTQRQINHGVFALLTLGNAAVLASLLTSNRELVTLVSVSIGGLLFAALWVAYWRGWEYACHSVVVICCIVLAVGISKATLERTFDHVVYALPVLALVLTNPAWMIGSTVILLAVLEYRTDRVLLHPLNIAICSIIVGGMIFSRLATDNSQRLEQAKRDAEAARTLAEAERTRAEEKTVELAQRNAEQQRLLELVQTLEANAIPLADGVLLSPIVGALDSRRAQAITSRLLHEVNSRRASQVILDVAGVAMVDTDVAKALLHTVQSLHLLGCSVAITGIAPTVAMTLTQLGVSLDGVTTARSPQEILAHMQQPA